MNRLQSELRRLYLPATASAAQRETAVRAMVLALARPADWEALSKMWQGVQAELGWPAPAIAVDGQDGCELWFSLAEPVPVGHAMAVLDALCARYLAGIAPERIRRYPLTPESPPMRVLESCLHTGEAPTGPDRWAAFVAPELAPVFAGTPWLDIPPNAAGQGELLSRLASIEPAAFERVRTQAAGAAPAAQTLSAAAAGAAVAETTPAASHLLLQDAQRDPRRFLLDVMNDERVALPLRIEAAKALLPYL